MIGTMEDGFVTLPASEYDDLEQELEQNQIAVSKLQWEISKLVEKYVLDEEEEEDKLLCVCDECIKDYKILANPRIAKEEFKWSN